VSGTTYTYTMGSDTFTLSQTGPDVTSGKYAVVSIGTVGAGTPQVANCHLSATISPATTIGNVLSSTLDAISLSKTVDDASPNSNDGTAKGKNSNAATVSTGVVGNSIHFDCSQYARIVYPGINAYNIYYSGTIMIWFKADNFNHTVAALLHKGQSSISCDATNGEGQPVAIFSDEVYTLQFWPASSNSVKLLFTLIDGAQNTGCSSNNSSCLCAGSNSWSSVDIYSNTTFNSSNTNKWYFVAVTWYYDSKTTTTTLNMYLNGVLDNSVYQNPFTPRTNTAPIILGSQADSSSSDISNTVFCGNLDEVNVYNSPLSAAAIKSYYCKIMTTDVNCK
jgi:hypothetical protein